MKILGIIPARGGSKGIPNKNITDFSGKPLIAWTIKAALDSNSLDKIIVSTDNQRIAEISSSIGAEVPFIRPSHLSGDDAAAIDVDIHAINWLENNENFYADYIVHLQPTSPFRLAEDIRNAIDLAIKKKADSVVSLCAVSEHPYWMKLVSNDGKITNFLNEKQVNNRQKLPVVYRLNGAIYIARTHLLQEKRTWFFEQTYAYIMARQSSIDIDEPFDLKIARLLVSEELFQ